MCEYEMFKYIQVLPLVFPASLSLLAPSLAPAIPHAASVSLGSLSLREGFLLASSHSPGPPTLDFLQLQCS